MVKDRQAKLANNTLLKYILGNPPNDTGFETVAVGERCEIAILL
jgi:hypothetical protein